MERNYFILYKKYKNKYINLQNSLKNNSQVGGAKENEEDKKDVFLFKADWCPHCQGFLPAWDKLKANYGKKYNFITYDGDKNKEEVESWKIQGFPTIIVKKNNKENEAMEYVGPNEYGSVLNFIENI